MRLLALLVTALLATPFAVASHDTCVEGSGGPDGDRDADGLPDAWEREHFKDLCQDGAGDYDHDGVSNAHEWEDGTDPTEEPDDSGSGSSGSGSSGSGDADDDHNKTDRSGRGDGSLSDRCRDRDDRRECVIDYCEDHPRDKQCKAVVAEACERRDCAALSRACANGDDRLARACDALKAVDEARVGAKHVDFELDRLGRQLLNYSIDGHVLFTSISYGDEDEDFELRKDGSRIRFKSDDARLEIHDSATGQFWFRSDDSALLLTLPHGVDVSPTSNGHLLDYGDRKARIAGDYDLDGRSIAAYEEFRFFSPVMLGASSDAVSDAAAAGHLGVEAKVSSAGSNVTAYDDVDVNITTPARITNETPLRIVVGAELDEGRTIIVDVDPALLTGPDLELRYFDVHDDGNETEVVFRMASSLADVLDPTDDGGQPEYWIVEDADGLHVMASIPHWSVHAIELASVGEFLVQPSVIIGVAAGVAGVGVAAVAMFWPRRQSL